MKRILVVAAASAAFTASPVFAQETDVGGVKVGLVGGYDVINLEGGGAEESDSGIVYGLTAGYDIDSGDAIIGLEAEVSDTSISDDVGDAGLDLYGGLRLGLQTGDASLVYVKAGYTNVDIDGFDNLEGIRVGAGYEKNFGSVFGRVEYRYSNYNVSDVIASNLNGNRNQIVLTVGGSF